jgi:ParB/RepB/Spo0J family partition protein
MNPITPHWMMDASQTPLEAEWHCLDMGYQHLRQRTPQEQRRLMLSIHTYGLLAPITVVPIASPAASGVRWTVIDGYLRIHATRALGKDKIAVQVCALSADEALLAAYKTNQSRPWKPLEEARLLQEIATHYNYSQAHLAQKFGKSETWVSHRLQLLTQLPEFVAQAVYEGALTCWSASRVLIPFARANPRHAEQFMDYLRQHPHSSREIQGFYEQYMRARAKARDNMCAEPALFLKVQAATTVSSSSKKSAPQSFPEQIWEQRLTRVIQELNALRPLLTALFYAQQPLSERGPLEKRLQEATEAMESLQQALRRIPYVQTTDDTNRPTVA